MGNDSVDLFIFAYFFPIIRFFYRRGVYVVVI